MPPTTPSRSIGWQAAGFDGTIIAGLWALGVVAEIVVFALSPRFTWSPTTLVAIGALSAVARWLITAQDLPLIPLAVVQLMHGLSFGVTQVGIMMLMVRHVPHHLSASAQGYLTACSGLVLSVAVDQRRRDLRALRSGRLSADGGDGADGRGHDLVVAASAGSAPSGRGLASVSPTARRSADTPCCRRSAGRRRGRRRAARGRRGRHSAPAAPAAAPAPSTARSPPCSRP